VDWDNDGKNDVIAGDTQGNVWLFLNTGTKEKPELAKGKLVEADGKPIKRGSHPLADTYSKLHVADWDGDGLKDLLIGHSRTVVFYKNVGKKTSPQLKAPVLVKIPEGNFPSRPSPYVVDWDKDGKKDLLVGCETAEIRFYRNEGTDKEPKLAAGVVLDLKGPSPGNKGYRWRLDVADWNNDGKLDLLVGNRVRSTKPSTGGNIWLFLGK
jgi:hypothetical protein